MSEHTKIKKTEGQASAPRTGSVSMLDKMNDLSRASLDNWGVEVQCDHLYEQIHAINFAHGPSKVRPDNKFATTGFVMELMVDEVHSEMVDQGFIPNS
jgi:hypothetical protein